MPSWWETIHRGEPIRILDGAENCIVWWKSGSYLSLNKKCIANNGIWMHNWQQKWLRYEGVGTRSRTRSTASRKELALISNFCFSKISFYKWSKHILYYTLARRNAWIYVERLKKEEVNCEKGFQNSFNNARCYPSHECLINKSTHHRLWTIKPFPKIYLVHTSTCTYTHTCTCTLAGMHICMYVCMDRWICIFNF